MYPERYRMPLWTKLTSVAVISALVTGCVQKTMGYVTPTPERSTTPVTEPYCDTHMLTIEPPNYGLNDLNPNELPILVENLIGPSGVGEVTGINIVKNPQKQFLTNVRYSAMTKGLDIDPSASTIVEFGMEGTSSTSCSPLVMVLGEKNPDGTQKSFLGFGVEQIDSNNDGKGDLEVLVPPFDGNVDKFLEMGQVDTNPNDNLVHIGPIDQLDPESIQPIFEIDESTGKVVFIPPFYQGTVGNKAVEVAAELGGNFIETSFRIDGQNVNEPVASSTPNPTITTPSATVTNEATTTPEIVQFKQCDVLDFLNCPITESQTPDYWRWVNETYAKNFTFDESKFNKDIVLFEALGAAGQGWGKNGSILIYMDPNNPLTPKFTDPETAPFKRNFTAAVVQVRESDGKMHDTVLLPVVYYNWAEPTKNILVMQSYTFFTPGRQNFTPAEEIEMMKMLLDETHFTPIGVTYFSSDRPFDLELALIKKVFQSHPDMRERFLKATNYNSSDPTTQDLRWLSDPSIVVSSWIAITKFLK